MRSLKMKTEHPAMIVIAGPSGVGKSTVIQKLMETQKDIFFSVSATTRAPRPMEKDGRDYYFMTKEKFEELLANDGLLEHTFYAGEYYGTPRAQIIEQYEAGKDVFFDVDEYGVKSIREKLPQCACVLLAPPSMEILEARLRGRGTETEEKIQKRLQTARNYYDQIGNFDYIISVESPEYAASRLEAILISQRQKIIDVDKIKELFI